MKFPSLRQRRHRPRRAMAVTELAVCLPVVTLIIFSSIEACSMIFLQQSLDVACYEASRVALVPKAQNANVKYQAELILTSRGVNGSQVSVTPADIQGAPQSSWIKVTATAPFRGNSLAGGWLFKNRTLAASVQMMKER